MISKNILILLAILILVYVIYYYKKHNIGSIWAGVKDSSDPVKPPTCSSEVGSDCDIAPCCPGLQCIGGQCMKCADSTNPNAPPVMSTCNVCAGMNIPVEAGGDPKDFQACLQCGNCDPNKLYDIQM
jgi:hypothetical protein